MLPLAGATPVSAGAADGPLVRFGVITDCQYADVETSVKMNRYYRLSPGKLKEAVEALNGSKLDFCVNLGDTIDRSFDSFEKVLPIFRELKVPLYHAIGNHDYSVVDEVKHLVPRRLGLERGTYFAWQVRGWRFVMLDGNDVSVFAHPKGSAEHAAAVKYMKSLPGKPAEWNGAISAGQIGWLRGQLEAARLHREKVVLFCHYPVFPVDPHNLWNAPEVVSLVETFSDVVAAWMNGHNHQGNYGTKHGVHFLNFKGMVDTEQNCWAEVAVHRDRLEVTGFAREPKRLLKVG